jgi:hypothetical protein
MFLNLIQKVYADETAWPGQGQVAKGAIGDYQSLIGRILENIVNPLIALMVGVAVIYFIWGVFEFIRNAESSDERKKGGMHMLYGAVGLFIMIAAYGILNLILGTIGKS